MVLRRSNEIIVEADSANDTLFLILEGGARVCLSQDDSCPIAELIPGDVIGEASTLSGRPASAWVISNRESWLLAIPSDLALSWACESHKLALNLLALACTRLRSSNLYARSESILNKHMTTLATTDALTGHLNRHWLEQNQQRLLGRCVLIIDIDHFKRINDEHGHAVGDQALKAVAQELRLQTRPEDALIRLGGEEFVVICRAQEQPSHIQALAERLRQAVASLEFRHSGADPDASPIPLTISVGVAISKNMETLDQQIDRADQALYRAKELGRNQIVVDNAISHQTAVN